MTRSAAIMQPAYLPWLGYFDLMDQVDEFVLLDTVEFSHQSWQHRNRIRTGESLAWLTIPVVTSGRLGQLISEVEIDRRQRFESKHLGSIQGAYARAPFFRDGFGEVAASLQRGGAGGRLVDVTIPLIDVLRHQLGITTPVVRASALGVTGGRADRLVRICQEVGADRYLSPAGAATYLREDAAAFSAASIAVQLHQYEHPTYTQGGAGFVSHAAALDLISWAGPASLEILRSGRRAPEDLEPS